MQLIDELLGYRFGSTDVAAPPPEAAGVVVLEMEMLTPTRTFSERHYQLTFGTFREDVANQITEAVKNFTKMYIMAESGMGLNMFSRLSI